MQKKIKIFDISRPLSSREPVYPGNSKTELRPLKSPQKDPSAKLGAGGAVLSDIIFGLHNGSHLDAPAHYVKKGKTVEQIPLEKCMGWARVVEIKRKAQGVKRKGKEEENEIGEKEIKKIKPCRGEIILFKTKNSKPAKKFNPAFTHLNEAAADLLAKAGVKAVGIDGPSIRKFRLRPDTVHPLLLKRNMVIYEGLNFAGVSAGRYYFIGLPLKIVGGEASPVRAILIKE